MDLFDVWQAIKPAITNQLKELKYIRANQQVRIPLDISGVLFEAIRGWVSYPALRKIQEQRQLLLKPPKASCTGTFTSSYGLPCVHTLKKLEDEGQALLLEHFHPHWHLKRDTAQPQPLLEPKAVPDRCTEKRSQPITSTRREPSGFEAVEGAARPRSQPKCSRCHTLGHIMTSRSCPKRYKELFQLSGSASVQTTDETIATTVAQAVIETTAGHTVAEQTDAGLTASVQALAGHMAVDQTAVVEELAGYMAASPMASIQELADHTVASQTAPAQELAENIAESQAASVQEFAGCIVVDVAPEQTTDVQALTDHSATSHTVPIQLTAGRTAAALRYDDPRAIYQRYVIARDSWYQAQPRGSIKTNQQYRKAMGLPQRYSKTDYQWCLDWKQMKKDCRIQGGSREWTKGEMMAYLDWSNAEDDRVEAEVAAEMERGMFSSRRGMHDIWEAAARDTKAQEAFYSSG